MSTLSRESHSPQNLVFSVYCIYFNRIIIEHAKGTERGSGGVPFRRSERDGYSTSSARKQRARDKYVCLTSLNCMKKNDFILKSRSYYCFVCCLGMDLLYVHVGN